MNRTSIEAINLVLATLNFDDAYPAQRELLREALEAAKRSQEQISGLSALCETLNKLQETAVQMIQPAVEAAVHKEREACAQIADVAEPYKAADLIRARSKDPMLFDDWGSIPYGGSK